MYYVYDCEFLEQGPTRPLSLISIGIVASDGRELYLQHSYARWNEILHLEDRWLHENVLPYLDNFNISNCQPEWGAILDDRTSGTPSTPWRTREQLTAEIVAFMDPQVHGPIERMIGYFSDYDHVLLCQLFGRMIDLPKGFKMWTWDLKQEADRLGIDWLGRMVPHDVNIDGPEHHALSDARWIMRAYRWTLEQVT